jgi:hypothetical protein
MIIGNIFQSELAIAVPTKIEERGCLHNKRLGTMRILILVHIFNNLTTTCSIL